MSKHVRLIDGPEGADIRKAIAGGFDERVQALLAGDYLRAGHRVGMRRAGEAVVKHAKVVGSHREAGNEPEDCARALAGLCKWVHDGHLTRELADERAQAEAKKREEEERAERERAAAEDGETPAEVGEPAGDAEAEDVGDAEEPTPPT